MPQTPVTSKTSLTRAQRRTALRRQLRDTGSTVWDNATLNECLNEALVYVRSRYPWRRTTSLASGKRLYDLPDDFVRMVEVVAVANEDVTGLDIDPRPHGRVITGYSVSAGPPMGLSDTSATSTAEKVVHFERDIPEGETWYITFESAMQDYGDASVVSGGVDDVAQDLCPGELTDGLAPLLLYAAARCAAYRYALNYIKSDGGDDFAAQYEYALRERDRLLADLVASPGQARFTTGLFSALV